jgi:hypothetical protein
MPNPLTRMPAAKPGHGLLAFLATMALLVAGHAADLPVFVPPGASSAERLAAADLVDCLGRLYPADRFTLTTALPKRGRGIVVGCATNAAVRRLVGDAAPVVPESFLVLTQRNGVRELGIVCGADARGTAYGVYALLEKLGCGFYLSGDALPAAKPLPFSFDGWQLSDTPLVRDRLVFDWHNFLSGCSTWNLPEWKAWIQQSLKMRYNTVMVHAYGNNPMVSYTFNGRQKPVGYLSTTARGRDWSTMHVNDVRRLCGGEVFPQPVFGAEAAQGPDDQRAEAARQLMHSVFAYAQQRGMEIYFANDVDTISANPQELIQTLPAAARFASAGGKVWLADPDTPEGYRYYKAQAAALRAAYPQITCLVVWFRTGGTPWMDFSAGEMPPRWQQEFRAEVARTPEAARLWHAHNLFGIGKIIRAWDRALRETGHGRVRLAAGTWDFKFLPPADRFFPPQVKLLGLDYNVLHGRPQLGDVESRRALREVGARRPVLPVIWAHHDDGNYIGRPYTPFADFASKLADADACGFGIIHWTTRPLDLFFASHARQVWGASSNEPLSDTCRDMAARSFGATAREPMGAYLERWATGAPMFGRETTDTFIDRPLQSVEAVSTGCRERRSLLAAVDRSQLTAEQRARVDYFAGLECFITDFHRAQDSLQRSEALLKAGDLAGARSALTNSHPQAVIKEFAAFSTLGGITRGEQGLVVSMNLRWRPYFLRQRQELGLEPVRFNFAPTSHDHLAQLPGKFTWHADGSGRLWQTLGAEETGASPFVLPPEAKVTASAGVAEDHADICRAGIESAQPIEFVLGPVMGHSALPAGEYRLHLLLLDPAASAPGQGVLTVSFRETAAKPAGLAAGAADPWPVKDRVDIFQETGGVNRVLERTYPVTLSAPGRVAVKLTPLQGKARISAAILEPAHYCTSSPSSTFQ